MNKLVAERISSNWLDDSKRADPAEVMIHMGCIQGQDYQSALWAIGMRSKPGTTFRNVEAAFSDRKIVRTWLLRGTIHIADATNVKWISKLLSPGLLKLALKREANRGIEPEKIRKIEEIFMGRLKKEHQLSRTDMYRLLEESGESPENNFGYHMLYRAAWDGIICYGDRKGDEDTFALRDEWINDGINLEGNNAIVSLAKLYFASHGPASLSDFAWWSGLKMKEIRTALNENPEIFHHWKDNPKLIHYDEDNSHDKYPENSVKLLPAYDEYFIGYADRSFIFNDKLKGYLSKDLPIYDVKFPVLTSNKEGGDAQNESVSIIHKNGIFQPLVLVDGQIAGTWTKKVTKDGMTLTIMPFQKFSYSEVSKLEDEVGKYGKFFEANIKLTILGK